MAVIKPCKLKECEVKEASLNVAPRRRRKSSKNHFKKSAKLRALKSVSKTDADHMEPRISKAFCLKGRLKKPTFHRFLLKNRHLPYFRALEKFKQMGKRFNQPVEKKLPPNMLPTPAKENSTCSFVLPSEFHNGGSSIVTCKLPYETSMDSGLSEEEQCISKDSSCLKNAGNTNLNAKRDVCYIFALLDSENENVSIKCSPHLKSSEILQKLASVIGTISTDDDVVQTDINLHRHGQSGIEMVDRSTSTDLPSNPQEIVQADEADAKGFSEYSDATVAFETIEKITNHTEAGPKQNAEKLKVGSQLKVIITKSLWRLISELKTPFDISLRFLLSCSSTVHGNIDNFCIDDKFEGFLCHCHDNVNTILQCLSVIDSKQILNLDEGELHRFWLLHDALCCLLQAYRYIQDPSSSSSVSSSLLPLLTTCAQMILPSVHCSISMWCKFLSHIQEIYRKLCELDVVPNACDCHQLFSSLRIDRFCHLCAVQSLYGDLCNKSLSSSTTKEFLPILESSSVLQQTFPRFCCFISLVEDWSDEDFKPALTKHSIVKFTCNTQSGLHPCNEHVTAVACSCFSASQDSGPSDAEKENARGPIVANIKDDSQVTESMLSCSPKSYNAQRRTDEPSISACDIQENQYDKEPNGQSSAKTKKSSSPCETVQCAGVSKTAIVSASLTQEDNKQLSQEVPLEGCGTEEVTICGDVSSLMSADDTFTLLCGNSSKQISQSKYEQQSRSSIAKAYGKSGGLASSTEPVKPKNVDVTRQKSPKEVEADDSRISSSLLLSSLCKNSTSSGFDDESTASFESAANSVTKLRSPPLSSDLHSICGSSDSMTTACGEMGSIAEEDNDPGSLCASSISCSPVSSKTVKIEDEVSIRVYPALKKDSDNASNKLHQDDSLTESSSCETHRSRRVNKLSLKRQAPTGPNYAFCKDNLKSMNDEVQIQKNDPMVSEKEAIKRPNGKQNQIKPSIMKPIKRVRFIDDVTHECQKSEKPNGGIVSSINNNDESEDLKSERSCVKLPTAIAVDAVECKGNTGSKSKSKATKSFADIPNERKNSLRKRIRNSITPILGSDEDSVNSTKKKVKRNRILELTSDDENESQTQHSKMEEDISQSISQTDRDGIDTYWTSYLRKFRGRSLEESNVG